MRVVMMMLMLVDAYLGLSSFPSVDLTQQVLLSLLEELVGELPSVRYNLSKTLVFPNTQKRKENIPFSKKAQTYMIKDECILRVKVYIYIYTRT